MHLLGLGKPGKGLELLMIDTPVTGRLDLAFKKRILMQIKLTAIALLAVSLHLSARSWSQDITISGKSLRLDKVFQTIEQQTDFAFVYDKALVDKAHPVSLNLHQVPLKYALDNCLEGQGLTYEIKNNIIVILAKIPHPIKTDTATLQATAIPDMIPLADSIRGRVLDENGLPVPGAIIRINTGQYFYVALTNDRGEFALKPSPNPHAIIYVSAVNIEPAEIPLNARISYYNITVKHRVTALNNVTVELNTGFQLLNKERATGSFGKPDMQTFESRVGSMDIIERLEGLVPGLVVVPGLSGQTANTNGNGVLTQASTIRGTSSIQLPTQPLYVINGVPTTDFSSVNVDDVADITVLKDAAAAAIWGAQAANGIIVVTTKEGLRNQRLSVSYRGFINYQGRPNFDNAHYMNSRQFIQAAKETFDPINYPWNTLYSSAVSPHDYILYNQYRGLISAAQANNSLDSLASIDNEQQIKDLFYRNAFTTNHTVSVSGGNNTYSFFGSLGYTDAVSNTPGSKNNTYRVSLSQSVSPNRNIKVSLNTELSDNVSSSINVPAVTTSFLPYQLFKDASGKALNMPYLFGWSDSLRQVYENRYGINYDYYPLNEFNLEHSSSNIVSFNVTANVGVKLWKGLSFQGTYGYLKSPGTNSYYDDNKSKDSRANLLYWAYPATGGSPASYAIPSTGGTYQVGNNDQRNWTVRDQLVYSATPRQGKDALDIQIGQDANESFNFRTSNTLMGYNEALGTYALVDYATLHNGISGVGPYNFSSLYSQPYQITQNLSRFTSWFALGSYTFDHKYSVDLSWRRDHSNLFGHDQSTQNKPTYSVGGKWMLSKEAFLQRSKWINNLGLRATYGATGNSPYVGAAALYDILGPETGNIAGNALSVNQPANTTLSWEMTHTTNLGLDFSLFKDRVGGNIDAYNKITTDLLGNVPLNPFSGFSGNAGNIGKLRNQGIEIALRTLNMQTKHFSWTTSFTFAYNKNKLVSYTIPNPAYLSSYSKLYASYYIGFPLAPLFAYQFAGLDSLGDPKIRLADKTITKDPNAAQLQDIKYMGSTNPPFNGGLTNTFTYSGFSLAINMIYRMGAVMRRPVNQTYSGMLFSSTSFNGGNQLTDFANRWKQPGDEKITNIPSYLNGYAAYSRRNTGYYTMGDINVVSASYVKIRDLTLSYNLQPKMLQAINVRTVNVYVQATNFLIWKANHYGVDPEYGYGVRPFVHSYSMGANVTF